MSSDASYRLAGIIVPAGAEKMAVIEMPDGKQALAHAGDTVGAARVVSISTQEVLLEFPHGKEVLRLTGALRNPAILQSEQAGVSADAFYKQIGNTPELAQSGQIPGLVDMKQLSSGARVVSVNGEAVTTLEAGVKVLRDALDEGRQVRLTLAGDTSLPVIYLGTGESFDELAVD